MDFRNKVESIPCIRHCFKPGLRALKNNSLKVSNPKKKNIEGSVSLDNCLAKSYPDDSRWDYFLCCDNKVYFLEVHPACTGDIDTMLNKLTWLKSWLQSHAKAIDSMKAKKQPFRWIATSGIHILNNSNQARKLAQSGLSFPVKHLVL